MQKQAGEALRGRLERRAKKWKPVFRTKRRAAKNLEPRAIPINLVSGLKLP